MLICNIGNDVDGEQNSVLITANAVLPSCLLLAHGSCKLKCVVEITKCESLKLCTPGGMQWLVDEDY